MYLCMQLKFSCRRETCCLRCLSSLGSGRTLPISHLHASAEVRNISTATQMCEFFIHIIIALYRQGLCKQMHFSVSTNKAMNSQALPSCRAGTEVRVRAGRGSPAPLGTEENSVRVTEDRGVESSRRRHQMGEREREVGCCLYPWEDRCGPRLSPSFTGSHLETSLASPTRDGTFASSRAHTWGHTHSDALIHTAASLWARCWAEKNKPRCDAAAVLRG